MLKDAYVYVLHHYTALHWESHMNDIISIFPLESIIWYSIFDQANIGLINYNE